VCRTADFEIQWGYVKQIAILGDDRSTHPNGLGPARCDESAVGKTGSATLSVRCPSGPAQRTGRPECRLEALAVAVLTLLGERDALVRDARQALRTATDDEGLSVREAVDWCGCGIPVREITRLLRLDGGHQDGQIERVG
jgi:hypothetical protein